MLQKIGKFIETLSAVFLSRKLIMAIVAIWMIYGVYWGAVQQLYTFEKPEQIVAFSQFTNHMMYGTITIALWYIGVQAASNFKNGLSFASLLQESLSSSSEKIESYEEKLLKIERLDSKDIDEEAFE